MSTVRVDITTSRSAAEHRSHRESPLNPGLSKSTTETGPGLKERWQSEISFSPLIHLQNTHVKVVHR